MIVWLQGISGSGKSTIGAIYAELHGYGFVDLDSDIERAASASIPDIIKDKGLERFRALERETLEAVVASHNPATTLVVATGGGAVLDSSNRDLMRSTGYRLFLAIDPETASQRLQGSYQRPLLDIANVGESLRTILDERLQFYHDCDAVVDASPVPEVVCNEIASALTAFDTPLWEQRTELDGEPSTIVCVAAPYDVHCTVKRLIGERKVFAITDENIYQRYPDTIRSLVGRTGCFAVVEPGEQAKSLATVERIAKELVQAEIDRDSIILGFGGGVVTDLAGFVASVYMRGLRCIAVPTSLLAQVDASVGGKTAVNAAGVRNLLGTFRQPSDVLICDGYLHTLPARELRSGIVEALKMGIAHSEPLLKLVKAGLDQIQEGNVPRNVREIVRLGVETKLDVVRGDVQDTGVRLSLNLGHTFGHALEAAYPETYTHGEAVAFGIIAASALAVECKVISQTRFDELRDITLPLTHWHGNINSTTVVDAMHTDKKRAANELRFILPKEQTGYRIHTVNDTALILSAIERASALISEYHTGL